MYHEGDTVQFGNEYTQIVSINRDDREYLGVQGYYAWGGKPRINVEPGVRRLGFLPPHDAIIRRPQ